MPRPHHTTQGGARHAALSRVPNSTAPPPAARAEKNTPFNALTNAKTEDRERQKLQAEVERLQRELARAKAGANASPASETVRSFWVAAALVGGSMLFALMALWRRG